MGIKSNHNIVLARRFLKTGKISGADIPGLASDCSKIIRQMTEKSSAKAIELGRAFVKHATPHKGILLQTAYRALGWTLLLGGEFSRAEKAYLKARGLVKGDAILRARIDRVLIDVYMYLGNFKESRRRARMAINAFQKLKAPDEFHKTRVNYANTLHRQDRHREALEIYREAGRYFSRKRELIASAFCFYNEANTLVQLFKFKPAEKLYLKAEEIFRKENYQLREIGCRYGLAWLYMLRGDYHIALKELMECEGNYRKAEQPREVILCQLDRAETYMGLNLFVDARRVSAEAEKAARKLGIQYESAKAALFFAKASLAVGKVTEARNALRRAEDGFLTEGNDAFLATVKLASISFENNTKSRISKIKAARRQFSRAQLPLWEAICDLQILSDMPDDKTVLNRLGSNPAVGAVPHLLARWHTMEGDRLARQGHLDAAIRNWQRACNVLDSVRAKLPPVDLRTSFLKNQADPYCRLIQAELENDPIAAAAWSEKYKTAGLWQIDIQALNRNPFRNEAEKSLSELAAQVTAFSTMLDKNGKSRNGVFSPGSRIFSDLQEKIRYNLAALDINAKITLDSLETICGQISSVASKLPIVQFHAGDKDLIAFVHYGKEMRIHRYIDGVMKANRFMGQWRFMVERAPFVFDQRNSIGLRDEKKLMEQIGEWLLEPLEISEYHSRLLILPEGMITNLPWTAIIYKGQHLANRFEIILSPSLRHYINAQINRTHSKRIEIFVGNMDNLTPAGVEYDILIQSDDHDGIMHDPCFRKDLPDNSKAFLWHFVGHAALCSDNPFYSALLMNDGPLYAADFRLKKNTVNLVTLAACRTGQQSYLPGEESVGLVRSLMEMGARNVLAGQCAVHNEVTAEWMGNFYRNLLRGDSIPSAMRKTIMIMQNKYPSAYHWGSFMLYGAG